MRKLVALSIVVAVIGGGVATSTAQAGTAKIDAKTIMFKKNLHKSKTVVNWWSNRGRWALFTRRDHCWQVIGFKQRKVCRHARHSLAAHTLRVKRLTVILAPPPTYGPMSSICGSSCISCESGWNPMAWNGTLYWGLYQFDLGTWVAHGGARSMYGKAGASEQHRVAANIQYDAWPNC